MGTMFAQNVISGIKTPAPAVGILLAGFPCTSRTSMSCMAAQNKGCVQRGEGGTGLGFMSVKAVVEKSKPRMIVLESVPGATSPSDTTDVGCDADFVQQELQSLGYWCTYKVFESREHRGFALRRRCYFIVGPRSLADAPSFCEQVIQSSAIGPGQPSDFATVDADQRKDILKNLGLGPWTAPRAWSCKAEPQYKDDHCAFYREHGMEWPPNRGAFREVKFEGMTDRVAELTIFSNHVFAAPETDGALEFFNANPTIKRLMIQGPED